LFGLFPGSECVSILLGGKTGRVGRSAGLGAGVGVGLGFSFSELIINIF